LLIYDSFDLVDMIEIIINTEIEIGMTF